MNDFIPKAIEVGDRLRANGSGDRYVWTTGSWGIWKYLRTASPEAVKRLEEAIGRGDIVWNSVPYTVESETMTRDMFENCLLLSKRLDERYGKRTIAAKMTDVLEHTRSIVEPMYNAGIRLLHVGINLACPVPSVPAFCRWRSPEGNDLILAYQKDYGEDAVLPDGKTVVSINFTGDNHGPHSYQRVKAIYADLRKRYPNARLVGASFNDIAQELLKVKESLPVVTSEIGDTWIYGYGSAPARVLLAVVHSARHTIGDSREDRRTGGPDGCGGKRKPANAWDRPLRGFDNLQGNDTHQQSGGFPYECGRSARLELLYRLS